MPPLIGCGVGGAGPSQDAEICLYVTRGHFANLGFFVHLFLGNLHQNRKSE